MDKNLLDIICCPVTRLPLEVLDDARLNALNAAIAAGKIRNAAQEALQEPISEALISRDGHRVYRVDEGIPILLEDECIAWSQVAA